MITQKKINQLKIQNEKIRKKAIVNNLKDCITFGDSIIHPDMDISLMNDAEVSIAHLFTHNSFTLSKPKFGKGRIKEFHYNLAKEMEKRGNKHPNVDCLDNIYK